MPPSDDTGADRPAPSDDRAPAPQGDRPPAPKGGAAEGEDSTPFIVVGLGASAGGLEALEAFFSGLPGSDGAAFVVVIHLPPDRESRLAEILERSVPLPVTQVTERVEVRPGHVYVIPPDRNLLVEDGHLHLVPLEDERHRRRPIDHFFRTLATAYGERAVGVVLSGTGQNGTVGVRQLREVGGLVLAQDPDDAAFDEMPRSAISAGVVDNVAPAAALGADVVAYAAGVRAVHLPEGGALAEDSVRIVRQVLAALRAQTGHDFAHYKRSTLLRRIARRMHVVGSRSLGDYLAHLQATPGESRLLLDDLLISVTNFFRDPEAFVTLEASVISSLFEGKGPADEVRVWTAGCATGEEAYSVAILLAEHAARLVAPPRIQVFATDLSARAVAIGRAGVYPESIEADVSTQRLRRFFRRAAGGYRVSEDLREMVLFAPHSLLRDPPFGHLDLVTCRNLLIYLERGLQQRVLELFHYALRRGGFLFLGTSETADAAGALYQPAEREARIYRRRGTEPVLPTLPRGSRRAVPPVSTDVGAPSPPVSFSDVHRDLRAEAAGPSILVSEGSEVVHLSGGAGTYLSMGSGEPTRNVLRLVLPALRPALQATLYQARRDGEAATSGPVRVEVEGELRSVRVRARRTDEGDLTHVLFEETPTAAAPADPSERETVLLEEVREVREQLQLSIEEFETSREEMRAQNEELQSINEELRSTAEELETAKEEAQSMAEELQTVNDEMASKVVELARSKGDLENLIAATQIATLFLDRDLRIQRFTPLVRDHFRVRPPDIGRPLADLAPRFGGVDLGDDAAAVLDRLEVQEREIKGDDGRWYLVHTRPYRTADDRIDGVVVTFVDITARRRSEENVRRREEEFRVLVETSSQIVWTTDADGLVVEDSPSWRAFTGQSVAEWMGEGAFDAIHPDDRDAAHAAWRESVEAGTAFESEFRLYHASSGSWRWAHVRSAPLLDAGGAVRGYVGMNADVTEQRQAELALRESEERFRRTAETVPDILFTAQPDGRVDYVNPRFEEVTGQPGVVAFGTDMWSSLIHPDDRSLQGGLGIGERDGPYETRHRLRMEDGTYRWFLTRAEPVYDADGAVEGWFGTSTDIDQVIRAEQEVQALNETLERRVRERTALARRLLSQLTVAEEEERRRISQVLHDDLQQQLYGLSMTITVLRGRSDDPDPFDRARRILDEAVELTRSLAAELSPAVLRAEDLAEVFDWLAEHVESSYGLKVDTDVGPGCQVADRNTRVVLYQVLREVLFNVIKHAETDRAQLSAHREGNAVVVRVEDRGVGFDSDAAEDEGTGLGLMSIRSRLELIGGQAEITSEVGGGTRITLSVPARQEVP